MKQKILIGLLIAQSVANAYLFVKYQQKAQQFNELVGVARVVIKQCMKVEQENKYLKERLNSI